MLQVPGFPTFLPTGSNLQWEEQPMGYGDNDHEELLILRRKYGQQQAEFKALQDKERKAQMVLRELRVAAKEHFYEGKQSEEAPSSPLQPSPGRYTPPPPPHTCPGACATTRRRHGHPGDRRHAAASQVH